MRTLAMSIVSVLALSSAACAHRSHAELLAQERSVCGSLPQNADVDADAVLAHETERVIPLHATGRSGGWLQGATLEIPPAPGRTPELLQRMLECRAAQIAVDPSGASEGAASPLAVTGVRVSVRSEGDRFAVELRGSPGQGREILSRAQAVWVEAAASWSAGMGAASGEPATDD